jgi:hypothetical protein
MGYLYWLEDLQEEIRKLGTQTKPVSFVHLGQSTCSRVESQSRLRVDFLRDSRLLFDVCSYAGEKLDGYSKLLECYEWEHVLTSYFLFLSKIGMIGHAARYFQ